MMDHMTDEQKRIHDRAKVAGVNYAKSEWEAIEALRDVQREDVHRMVGKRNLYTYAVEVMGLSEGTAYSMTAIAKKSFEIGEILPALKSGKVSANKISRMLSVISKENAVELIGFASVSTTKELDFKVAQMNPKPKRRTSVRAVDGDRVRVAMDFTREELKVLERARDLMAGAESRDLKKAVLQAAREYIERRDPVAKAKRAQARRMRTASGSRTKIVKTEKSLHKNSARSIGRVPRTAEQTHGVNLRDRSQCTFIDGNGRRCGERKDLHVHHVLPVSRGGSNDPENLTTLCVFHHELVHQLSLPLDGQVSWIREPSRTYVA